MRKILLSLFTGICITTGLVNTQGVQAQLNPFLYGTSPFQDSAWGIDTTDWSVKSRYAPSLAGFTITGITGMCYDPIDHDTYVIMKLSGVSGRVLGKMDVMTGVCTQVGNLGDNFATINFREDGQLFGVTGNGAAVPETMYLIDKATGTKTLAAALGSGADGEVISYNYDDNMFYHWSGNGTVVYETVMSVAPYTFTNIPISGTTSGETFGALYLGNNKFIGSNISSSFNRWSSSGVVSAAFGSNPDDLRGVIIPPIFRMVEDSICQGATASFESAGIMYADSIRYIWGDGSADEVGPNTNTTHTYTTAGTMTAYAVLYNAIGVPDTMYTHTLEVVALPTPSLTPASATLCNLGDVLVVDAGIVGASYQWYENGLMIPGANGDTLDVDTIGTYNVVVTNSFGCSDSSATPFTVDLAPDLFITSSTGPFSICPGDSVLITATAGFDQYDWLQDGNVITSGTQDFVYANAQGNWTVNAYYAGCFKTAGVVTVSNHPTSTASYTQSADTLVLTSSGLINFTNASTNCDSVSWDFGDGGSSTQTDPSYTYTAAGVYTVTMTCYNLCGNAVSTSTVTVLDSLVGRSDLLAQNAFRVWPNPAQDRTTFEIGMNRSQHVSLVIWNAAGQQVQVLYAGEMPAGTLQIRWDASRLPAGMYQAVLTTPQGLTTRTVILE